ncbi:hypothetical protein AB0N06_04105 [Streptomyces sp. NPDC051020]|uniref:hypothetical protein n=1 Tax=Streptomyces sp. NPDC051020 TaxID=3155409 RepID=UPI00342112D1
MLARELAEDLIHGTETVLRSATAQNPNLEDDEDAMRRCAIPETVMHHLLNR